MSVFAPCAVASATNRHKLHTELPPYLPAERGVSVSLAFEGELKQRLQGIEGKLDELTRKIEPALTTHRYDAAGHTDRPGFEEAPSTSPRQQNVIHFDPALHPSSSSGDNAAGSAANGLQRETDGPAGGNGMQNGMQKGLSKSGAPPLVTPLGQNDVTRYSMGQSLSDRPAASYPDGADSDRRDDRMVTLDTRPSVQSRKSSGSAGGRRRSAPQGGRSLTHGLSHLSFRKGVSNVSIAINNYSTHGRKLGKRAEAIHILLTDPESSARAKCYRTLMQLTILVSVITPLMSTMDPPPLSALQAGMIEVFFDLIFLGELVVRFLVNPAPKLFLFDTFNVIDLMAGWALILRFAMALEMPRMDEDDKYVDWRAVILLCFLPIIRLLKILRRWDTVHLLMRAFSNAFEALPILLFPIVVITLTFASLIYIFEPRSNIPNMSTAVWLTIVTMTTVGYGDYTPVSTVGFCVVGVLVISSVMYMAMPLGIVGNSFMQVWQDRDAVLLMHRTRERLLQWGYTANDIAVLFQVFDKDRSGDLDISEFSRMIKKMKLGLSDKRILDLFKVFDDDGSGLIDDREFVKTLFPHKYLEVYGDQGSDDDDLGVVHEATNRESTKEFGSEAGQSARDATLVAEATVR